MSSFGYAGDAALVIDDERRCVAVNSAALALLEVPPGEDVIGRRIEKISRPPSGVDIDEAWRNFIRSGAYDGVVVFPRDDGSRRYIEWRARARADERAHVLVARDVTRRVERETAEREARERLEAERAKLRAMVMDLPIAIVVFAVADFRIDVANSAYLAMVGREQVVGLTLDQIVPDVSPESIYAYLSEVRREK